MAAAFPHANMPSAWLITDGLAVHAPLTVRHAQWQELTDLVIPVGILNRSRHLAGQALEGLMCCWQTIVIVKLKVSLHEKQCLRGLPAITSQPIPGAVPEMYGSMSDAIISWQYAPAYHAKAG